MLTGLIYFGGTLYWVVQVMAAYGGLSTWVAAPVGLLLVAYLALYPGLFALAIAMAVQRFGVAGVWFAPFLWVATEWMREWMASGFPWAILGSSQATVIPVVQLASITGVYGLSALIALVATAAAALALSRRPAHRWGAAGVALLLIAVAVFGTVRVAGGSLTSAGTAYRVGLIQGNIDQSIKWNPAHRDQILEGYIALSRQAIGQGAQLVMWPEASTPFYFEAEGALAVPVRRLAIESRTPFLIGTDEYVRPEAGGKEQYYNSASLVGPDGRTHATYRKMRLVPFGEYVPLQKLLFFVGPLVEAVSDFSMGTDPVVFDLGGHKMSVAICYESIYPWISRAFVTRGSELLATITNDAWFGRSSAAFQHFEQGAIRAVEQGRYVVRAANTGISGAVDPYGRPLAQSRLFERTTMMVDVRLLTHRTIYSYVGDVVAWFSAAVLAFVILIGIGGLARLRKRA